MNSYNIIDYSIRPQKRIERALFAEVLNSISIELDKGINYVGMGSLFFADFVYFKKMANIERMISLEFLEDKDENKKIAKQTRFKNNKPLNDIQLIMKKTSEAIDDNDIPFDSNNFIWFDYDNTFQPYYIHDLSEVVRKAEKTSLIAVSYNSDFVKFKDKKYWKNRELDLDAIIDDYQEYFPSNFDEKRIDKHSYNDICEEILEEYIVKVVNDKNIIALKKPTPIEFKIEKISEITYGDGAEMKTILWILYDNTFHFDIFKKEIEKRGIQPKMDLKIKVLTLYEKQLLDRQSKDNINDISINTGLDKEVIEQYYKYSKYIPEYSEILI